LGSLLPHFPDEDPDNPESTSNPDHEDVKDEVEEAVPIALAPVITAAVHYSPLVRIARAALAASFIHPFHEVTTTADTSVDPACRRRLSPIVI
jgi:hypothetical protein